MVTRDSGLIGGLIPTLFEDRGLLVVGKPAGVDVGAMPAPDGKPQRGIAEILAEMDPEHAGLLPVNRLSRYETGILIFAKTAAIAERLRTDWRSGRVEQEYLAVVLGRVAKKHFVLGVDAPVETPPADPRGRRGRSATFGRTVRGRSRGPKGRGPGGRGGLVGRPVDRRRGAVREIEFAPKPAASKAGLASKPALDVAQTTVDLIRQGERRAVIRCRTNAPNTHVLRAQLRASRMRVLGDHLKDPTERKTPVEQTFLHLGRVSLNVAEGEKPLVFRLDPPSDPADYLERVLDYGRFLNAGLVRRLPLLDATETDSYRLLTGPVEAGVAGLRGLVAEKYGPLLILQVHTESAADVALLRNVGRWYREFLDIQTVLAKDFGKGERLAESALSAGRGSPRSRMAKRKRASTAEDIPQRGASHDVLVLGPSADDEVVVTENGLRFSIRPAAGQSVGLFLDQRENRKRIREMSAGKDVLNLFAYTCGFSVAAAAGGARSTASVDISPKHLDWGRRNFKLNEIDIGSRGIGSHEGTEARRVGSHGATEARRHEGREASDEGTEPGYGQVEDSGETDDERGLEESVATGPAHLFFKSDAAEFLKRAKRQKRFYDIIILDAPSFAHARGRGGGSHFHIERDLATLVSHAAEVMRPEGTMLISTNYRQMTADGLRRRIREAAGARKITFGPMLPLPIDFAADSDHAKAVVAYFD